MSVATSTSVSVEPDVGGDERLGAIKKLFEKKQPPPGPGGGTDGGGDDWDPFPTDPWDTAGMLAWFERHPEVSAGGGRASQWVAADEPTPNETEAPREKICGLDVTASLVAFINSTTKSIAELGIAVEPYILPYSVPSGLFDLNIVGDYKVNGIKNEFKGGNPPQEVPGGTGQGCPTDCEKSVTICGICLDQSVPGNILFGANVAAAGENLNTALYYSSLAETMMTDTLDPDQLAILTGDISQPITDPNNPLSNSNDPPHDINAVSLGHALYHHKKDDGISVDEFCEEIKKGGLQGRDCKPCAGRLGKYKKYKAKFFPLSFMPGGPPSGGIGWTPDKSDDSIGNPKANSDSVPGQTK